MGFIVPFWDGKQVAVIGPITPISIALGSELGEIGASAALLEQVLPQDERFIATSEAIFHLDIGSGAFDEEAAAQRLAAILPLVARPADQAFLIQATLTESVEPTLPEQGLQMFTDSGMVKGMSLRMPDLPVGDAVAALLAAAEHWSLQLEPIDVGSALFFELTRWEARGE
jgi:hypothetical protein